MDGKNEKWAAWAVILFCLIVAFGIVLAGVNRKAGIESQVGQIDDRVAALESNIPTQAVPVVTTVTESVSEEQIRTIVTTVRTEVEKELLDYVPTADCVSVSAPGEKEVVWNCKQRG